MEYTLSGEFGGSSLEPTVDAILRTLHQRPDGLNTTFFSSKNIDHIQKHLIHETKRITGFEIGKQSETDLITIMIASYVQYSTFDGNNADAARQHLNKLVVAQCLSKILPGIRAYLLYVRDASKPFGGGGERAFARPMSTSVKGSKTTTGFLPLHR